MSIFCWGSTQYGELGLGGLEEEHILTPCKMNWSESTQLNHAACGAMHTLFLTKEGKIYSCGNNDNGQLGHDLPRKRPQLVTALDNYCITQVSCGAAHSMAMNEWGQVFMWGSNAFGQLGNETEETILTAPKIVKELATKQIVQIACGEYHCLVLSNNGELYSWGHNRFGQLGLGFTSEKVSKPTLINSLAGIPFAFIACGGYHSFAISKSGAIFGWGKNSFGQLGLNDDSSKSYPCQLKTLRSRGIRYIACGEDFSVFLTHDGGVFTCGLGTYGQLGHGIATNEKLPRMVMELMGSTITQVSCGRRHTLAFVPSRGRVYGFGLGGSGQLGTRGSRNSTVPQVVIGPWVSPGGTTLLSPHVPGEDHRMIIKRIYSGGDHCFVSVVELSNNIQPDDCRIYEPSTQILSLSVDLIKSFAHIDKNSNVDLDLLTTIETIFKSQNCINSSFLLGNNDHICCTSKNCGIDIEKATEGFELIRIIENETIKQLIWDGMTNELMNSLVASPADVETLRIYLIFPLYHEFINVKNYLKLHTPFSQALTRLGKNPMTVLVKWLADISREYFERLIEIFKSVAYYIIHFHILKRIKTESASDSKQYINFDSNLKLALEMMMMLYQVNHKRKVKGRLEAFHIPELSETADIQEDFLRWNYNKNSNGWYLCSYPFLFDGHAKTVLLQTDQAIQMHQAIQSAAAQSFLMLMTGSPVAVTQFTILNVSRENLVADTIRELTGVNCGSDLKKPLKIKFSGEEAEDAGGVRKEFFMLLLREILDPKFGMFRQFEDSRLIWFSEDSFEEEVMYQLIGIICGLAIYNFTIINLPFPLALFKKLLKEEPIDIGDLRDLSPQLANSMQSILDYNEPDFEEVFNIFFDISREVFGETKKILLKPNGDKIPVTLENKQEFVNLYIDFVFNKSVERYFAGFSKGFMKVCGGRVLEIFTAQELMSTVVGNENYDWLKWQEVAEYKNGYTSSDETIQLFWEVFHELSEADKRNFLLFLTGSDRIPMQGMKEIKITIQPMKDDKYLPVAHTCFNLLDLPRFKTKEKLKYKLLQSIQQTQGFSLV